MLLLLFVAAALGSVRCNDADRAIYARDGDTFPARFRSFAGVTVSKSSYESQIVRATALSASCASCYGEAYICGWDNCRWSCVTAGASCNACLGSSGCVSACNACTGF